MRLIKIKKQGQTSTLVIFIVSVLISVQLAIPHYANGQYNNGQYNYDYDYVTTLLMPATPLTSGMPIQSTNFLPALKVEARAIGNLLVKTVYEIISFLFGILTKLAGFVLYLGAQILTAFFQLNNRILEFPIVDAAWKITRDIANLGFVIALIVTAFMTILRVGTYNAQKMLPKIITAAILVNFSLAIAGFLIDFSNVLTKFFVDRSLYGGSYASTQDIGSAIAGTLNPQQLYKMDTSTIASSIQSAPNTGTDLSNQNVILNIISLFAIFIFTFFMAILLLADALMLLTRFAWLTVLVGVSPIPWVLGVIPIKQMKDVNFDWWEKFLKWVFVAPILSFFIYLTLKTAVETKNIIASLQLDQSVNFTFIDSFLNTVVNILVMGSFLTIGLITSQEAGGKLSAMTIKAGQGIANNAKKALIAKTASGASKLGRKIITAGSGSDAKGKSWAEKLGESGAGKIPVIGAAFRGIAGVSAKAKEKAQQDIEKAQKKYDSLSKDVLKNRINSQIISKSIGAMNEDDVGAALALAKKGGWNELDDRVKRKLTAAIKRAGAVKKLAAFDPLAASSMGMPIEEAVPRVENVHELPKDIIKEIAPYLLQEQIRQLGLKGSHEKKQAFIEGLDETFIPPQLDPALKEQEKQSVKEAFQALTQKKKQLNEILKNYQNAKDKQDQKAIETLQKQRDSVKEDISNLEEILVNGGEWTERIQTNLVDANGNPIVQTGKTIKLTKVEKGEEKNKRRDVLGVRNNLAKQTIWQGTGLFEHNPKPNEEKNEGDVV